MSGKLPYFEKYQLGACLIYAFAKFAYVSHLIKIRTFHKKNHSCIKEFKFDRCLEGLKVKQICCNKQLTNFLTFKPSNFMSKPFLRNILLQMYTRNIVKKHIASNVHNLSSHIAYHS